MDSKITHTTKTRSNNSINFNKKKLNNPSSAEYIYVAQNNSRSHHKKSNLTEQTNRSHKIKPNNDTTQFSNKYQNNSKNIKNFNKKITTRNPKDISNKIKSRHVATKSFEGGSCKKDADKVGGLRNINNNCIRSVLDIFKNKNISIDINGKLFKILPLSCYKTQIMKIINLIIVGLIANIIKRFPYNPITITGNTVYTRVVAACLSKFKIPYVLCKGTGKIQYYELSNGTEIPFEGPSPSYFDNCRDKIIPLIPHTKQEIDILENHTGFSNLSAIQSDLLKKYNFKGEVHLASLNEIIHNGDGSLDPIITIKKMCNNLYYIRTANDTWLSRIIITDNVESFQPGEIISGLYGKITSQNQCLNSTKNLLSSSIPNYDNILTKITHNSDNCIIMEPDKQTILYYHNNYMVKSDLSVQLVTSSEHTYDECILYNLKNPRPWVQKGIFIIHPFHLPRSWDPFFTITLITTSLIALLS